jgi:hypothetical protein
MSRLVLPRRTFLRGAGGLGLALPLFSSLGCSPEEQRVMERVGRSQQRAGRYPKRFIFMITPNGSYVPPTMALPDYWSVLEPVKQKISFVTGLDLLACMKPPGEPHQQGMALLTGRPLNSGTFVGGDGSLAGWASGISLDQEIAKTIGQMTKRPTLNLGVQSTNQGGTEVRTVCSYADADVPVPNETNPWHLFEDLFSNLGTDPVGADQLKDRRKSVLDRVDKRYAKLSQKLSGSDQKKLEQHLEAVREVERRLDAPGGVIGGDCQMPTMSDAPNDLEQFLGDPTNFPTIAKLQIDLMVMAFACDLSRVATLQFSASINNRPHPWLEFNGAPILDDEHGLSHQPDSNSVAVGKLGVIRRWNIEQLLYLMQKLDTIEEDEGTMLDNTAVVLTSELTKGNSHSQMDQFFLVGGGCGGALKMGQHLDYALERGHNDLLLSLLHAFGIEASTFGDEESCTGPLTELMT